MEKTAKKKGKVKMPGSLRNKLTAALCMLLVSSIMMVTSTYAWFTLSTAPEVTNISTTVAGNGSLEIALMPANGLPGSIAKGGNSMGGTALKTVANTSWGNIVDLSEVYGLEAITLQPSTLDTADLSGLLKTAEFGSDGRISTLTNNTDWAKYDAGETFVPMGDTMAYGVRAIATGTDAGGTVTPYGYVVDLAFRINTDNDGGTTAKLQLQTEAIQRIDGSANAATMGGGSNMTVKLGAGVTMDTAKKMMSAITVTFVKNFGLSGGTPEILAIGTLDTTGALSANAQGEYTVPLTLKKADGTPATELTELPKNQAVQISAIVWMSGESLTNSAFAIDGNTLTGTLNLQFTTDVTLTPAQNADLFQTERN